MKNKGFTMVELLVTIIIIGILTTLAYFGVSSILNRGSNSYYDSEENMLVLAGREYFADYREKLPKDIGKTSSVTLDTLIKESYIEPVKDEDDNDCNRDKTTVTVQKITDKDYQYYVTLVCDNYETTEDNAKPVISFSPNKKSSTKNITVTMEVTDNKEVASYRYVITKDGEEYKDSGYQNYTGPITIKLTEKGLYEIVGYAYDASGNRSSKRSGKYSIYEGIDCAKVEFDSNINVRTWTNKDITVTMKLPDNTYRWELSRRVDGGEYVEVDNYIGAASRKLTFNTEGKHQLKLVLYDRDGNSCIATTGEYYIDKTKPSCTSSGGSSAWTSGNRTLIGTCSDSGSGCTGNAKKVYDDDTNKTNQSPGTVEDKAGNTASCPANQTVRVDKTAPKCTSSGGSSAWQTSSVTLKGTCSDKGGSGCKGNVTKKYTSSGEWLKQSPGTVEDNVGHTTKCPANQTVRIAFLPTKPTINLNGYVSGSWTNKPVTITTTSQSYFGIDHYEYSHNGWDWKNEINELPDGWHRVFYNNRNKMDITIDWQSSYDYFMKSVDKKNRSSEASNKFTVNIDTTPPTCTVDQSYMEYQVTPSLPGFWEDRNKVEAFFKKFSHSSWTKSNRTVRGYCSDEGGSGCRGDVNKTYSGTYYSGSPGYVYDNAGNRTQCENALLHIDNTAPYTPYLRTIKAGSNVKKVTYSCSRNEKESHNSNTCNATIYVNNRYAKSYITVYVDKDDLGSGIDYTLEYFSANGSGASYCNWKENCGTKSFGTNASSAVMKYKSVDNVGNQGKELTINYKFVY